MCNPLIPRKLQFPGVEDGSEFIVQRPHLRQMLHIELILPDLRLVGRPGLRADQSLWRTAAIGHVRQIATMPLDGLVQMVATVPSHAKPMFLLGRILQEVA